jgi:hypothetical protein
MTSSAIETTTFRLVAYCLSQLRRQRCMSIYTAVAHTLQWSYYRYYTNSSWKREHWNLKWDKIQHISCNNSADITIHNTTASTHVIHSLQHHDISDFGSLFSVSLRHLVIFICTKTSICMLVRQCYDSWCVVTAAFSQYGYRETMNVYRWSHQKSRLPAYFIFWHWGKADCASTTKRIFREESGGHNWSFTYK